jgi:two-component system sensor histidine kinase CpxA
VLLAVSDSITGNGFFFDPLPWMIVALLMVVLSLLLWVPLIRSITRPVTRMTRAAESIALGNFDVHMAEPRADEIGRLAGAINHMTSRLKGFVNGQKRFLGDIAHELTSPMARIQVGLGILEQKAGPESREQVADVMADVDHMSNLVGELLSFSRAGMNPEKMRLAATRLLPLVQQVVQREGGKHAQIHINIDKALSVLAVPELLSRALANIVRNAVVYAGDRGPIRIDAERVRDTATIRVTDPGPGVPEEFMAQLFEPFFRPEPSRDRDSGGVGLGLAIVKTCIDACKGSVSARNLKPGGFEVSVMLTAHKG